MNFMQTFEKIGGFCPLNCLENYRHAWIYYGFYFRPHLMWGKEDIMTTGFSMWPSLHFGLNWENNRFLKLVPEHEPHCCKIGLHHIALVCLMKQLSVHMCMLLHHAKHPHN